jgi:predicted DNA-binding transcriptional regulator AlpA
MSNSAEIRPASEIPSFPGERLLSAKTCAATLEIAESTWWAWVSDPAFPVRPIRYGERFTRFRQSELSAWMASLAGCAAKPSIRRSGIVAAEHTGAPSGMK